MNHECIHMSEWTSEWMLVSMHVYSVHVLTNRRSSCCSGVAHSVNLGPLECNKYTSDQQYDTHINVYMHISVLGK